MGGLHLAFAMLKSLYLIVIFLLFYYDMSYDVLIFDQLCTSIPIVKLWFMITGMHVPILFYCHFPDKLLTGRGGRVKNLYRIPLDAMEEWCLGYSDFIVFNSNFTMSIFNSVFKRLSEKKTYAKSVIYPGIVTENYEKPLLSVLVNKHKNKESRECILYKFLLTNREREGRRKVILSLNRFERKKNIELAVYGLSMYINKMKERSNFVPPLLIVSGGYDHRIEENRQYYEELQSAASLRNIIYGTFDCHSPNPDMDKIEILFLPSISSETRNALLWESDLIIYTPSNEHFGIVPIEAMFCETIVIASRSGGPEESIVDKKTGFLLDEDGSQEEELGNLIDMVLSESNSTLMHAIRLEAKERVLKTFTIKNFVDSMENVIKMSKSKTD